MTTHPEAIRLAREALQSVADWLSAPDESAFSDEQMAALRLALAALNALPAGGEPVARVVSWTNASYGRNYRLEWLRDVPEGARLYATPPAQPAAQREGWQWVPVEPTPEMLKAADDGDDAYTLRNFGPCVRRVMQGPYDHWHAMLAAAPKE